MIEYSKDKITWPYASPLPYAQGFLKAAESLKAVKGDIIHARDKHGVFSLSARYEGKQ